MQFVGSWEASEHAAKPAEAKDRVDASAGLPSVALDLDETEHAIANLLQTFEGRRINDMLINITSIFVDWGPKPQACRSLSFFY